MAAQESKADLSMSLRSSSAWFRKTLKTAEYEKIMALFRLN
jgi:hypothetical protein